MEYKYEVGDKHRTNEGYLVEIVEKLKYPMRRIRFENGYEVVGDVSAITRGSVKNPYHPSVRDVGYLGVGEYNAKINKKDTLEYMVWRAMLRRCYNQKWQEKYLTYKGVVVCEEWHNFQNFADFYHKNKPKVANVKFQLDKDLLQQNIENKIYSQKTCIFLPHNVNLFLANKHSANTSGYIGVCWDKTKKKWVAEINLFGEGKYKKLGRFSTPEEASISYQQARAIESEKVKSYLRSLNYLSEEIIQLVK